MCIVVSWYTICSVQCFFAAPQDGLLLTPNAAILTVLTSCEYCIRFQLGYEMRVANYDSTSLHVNSLSVAIYGLVCQHPNWMVTYKSANAPFVWFHRFLLVLHVKNLFELRSVCRGFGNC